LITRVWKTRASVWVALALALACLGLVAAFVDLSPKVEGEFFFADDDPQMQVSEAVNDRFPGGAQIVLRVAALVGDREDYLRRVSALTDDLLTIVGVDSGYSISTDDPSGSPLFQRLLLTPDPAASNIILQVDDSDPEDLLPRIETVVDAHRVGSLSIVVSGVPAIVELIRRSLYRDLIVFSSAAVIVFTLLMGLVFRDVAIVMGTLATCFVSVGGTLLVVQAVGIPIGLLTANLVTIVFVLTLSHVVFLTANWSLANIPVEGVVDRGEVVQAALKQTWEGSFWSMTTTLLGFVSLLAATARPLRELGLAGAIGTIAALLAAYSVFPPFLGAWATAKSRPISTGSALPGPQGGRWAVPCVVAAVLLIATGATRLDTDPGLLSYFAEGSELRDGLAQIDADGGSSTLKLVVSDASGEAVDSRDVFDRMEALQEALESDPSVGVVLSPTVLIGHARTIPLAGLLPVGTLLDIASSDALGGIGRGFVTPSHDQALFSLRMREGLDASREEVIQRLRFAATSRRFDVVAVAGLYDLQGQLGRLIASSLRIGIGGLLLLFFGVALCVSRSPLVAVKMWVCLAAIPAVILGVFGHFGVAVDIITSPAANIALAIGADSMIHLVVRARRLSSGGAASPWPEAVQQLSRPVLGATGIICAGFGLFALSSFPPTQRFGVAVVVGTLAAVTMALIVLPRLARPRYEVVRESS
jgi:predicted RND superfamily exporter protein